MLEYFSPSCGYIAEQFTDKIKFFSNKNSIAEFTTKPDSKKEPQAIDYVYLLSFIVALVINLSIMYYAMKFACSEGFDLKNFMLAYFLTLPYLLYKLIMKKCSSK
jgi:hypothetical protein